MRLDRSKLVARVADLRPGTCWLTRGGRILEVLKLSFRGVHFQQLGAGGEVLLNSVGGTERYNWKPEFLAMLAGPIERPTPAPLP